MTAKDLWSIAGKKSWFSRDAIEFWDENRKGRGRIRLALSCKQKVYNFLSSERDGKFGKTRWQGRWLLLGKSNYNFVTKLFPFSVIKRCLKRIHFFAEFMALFGLSLEPIWNSIKECVFSETDQMISQIWKKNFFCSNDFWNFFYWILYWVRWIHQNFLHIFLKKYIFKQWNHPYQ